MNQQLVFEVLLILGIVWTGVWIWVLTNSRQTAPYTEVASRVAVLRRRLLILILAVMVVVFLVALRWLPYPPVRAITLGQPQVTVEVTAQQWSWSFSQTEIPAGVPVEFAVTSRDVNHGFGLYDPQGRLVAQVQAMPGYTNRLIHLFDQPGTYTVRCLELCGIPHHLMVATLTVR